MCMHDKQRPHLKRSGHKPLNSPLHNNCLEREHRQQEDNLRGGGGGGGSLPLVLYNCGKCVPNDTKHLWAVSIQWNGLLEWTTGMPLALNLATKIQ